MKASSLSDYELLLTFKNIVCDHYKKFFCFENSYGNLRYTILFNGQDYIYLADIQDDLSSYVRKGVVNPITSCNSDLTIRHGAIRRQHGHVQFTTYIKTLTSLGKSYNRITDLYNRNNIEMYIDYAYKSNPDEFDRLFEKLNIRKKALQKQKLRKQNKERSARKRRDVFTHPQQKRIALEVNSFLRLKYLDALVKASEELKLKDSLGFHLITFPTEKYKTLHGIHHGLIDANSLDRTGEALYSDIRQLPYGDQIMNYLLHLKTTTTYEKDLAAACRRFAIAFGEPENIPIGLLDDHEMVREMTKELHENLIQDDLEEE